VPIITKGYGPMVLSLFFHLTEQNLCHKVT
jgi:hypothetical protein